MIHFDLDDEQAAKVFKWNRKHLDHCPLYGKDGAIGGRVSYTFTPTSLGQIVKVKCACGSEDSEVDLTDYENW